MRVDNVKIYDLDESIIASGYPMRTSAELPETANMQDMKRAIKLTQAANSGNKAHEQFLTGIRVNFDLTCTVKMWTEAERYRFLEFVSSQSTMHRITKFEIRKQYNQYVDSRIIDIMEEKVKAYNEAEIKNPEKYLEILYSNPCGFNLTARMTTNYRCLKNIYLQRKDHRLPEWREFCKWIETLPYFNELLKI